LAAAVVARMGEKEVWGELQQVGGRRGARHGRGGGISEWTEGAGASVSEQRACRGVFPWGVILLQGCFHCRGWWLQVALLPLGSIFHMDEQGGHVYQGDLQHNQQPVSGRCMCSALAHEYSSLSAVAAGMCLSLSSGPAVP
jgi:hypothetical protein